MSDLLKVRVGGSRYLCKWDPHSNEVKIGDRWYPYVQIGRQLWITENLALDISSSITNAEHPEFGRYYNFSQMDAIPCPQGWRSATYSDLQSLDSNANHLSDKLLVSGDLGFNAMLCGEYYSNFNIWDGVGSVFKMWSSTEYSTGNRYELSLYPNNPIQIGFGTDIYRPVRLCKDATVNIGGRDYPTTRIGNQIWLAENLDLRWEGLNIGGYSGEEPSIASAWYYDDNEQLYGYSGRKCGLLYNGIAVDYLENNKSTLLPSGWRVPIDSDYDNLAQFIGGTSTAGQKLKAINGDWITNWNGMDTYGYRSVPSGRRVNASFSDIAEFATYWCYKEESSAFPLRFFSYDSNALRISESGLTRAYSLRLVKDVT